MITSAFLVFFMASTVSHSLQADVVKPNYNSATDGVVEITQKNFKTLVLNSEELWLVIFEFSGPGCQPCIDQSVVIKKAVPLLKQKKINVGFVDASTADGQKLSGLLGLTSFPKKYIYGKDKDSPIIYPYTPQSAEQFAGDVDFLINKPPAAEGQCGKDTVLQNPESATYELTDENFDQVVLKCDEAWMVNFYHPNFDGCTQFKPFFEAAAKEFKGRVKFGSLYMLGSSVAQKYNVTYVCTVKLFPAGDKSGQPLDYNKGMLGSGISANLIPWLKNATAASLPAPEINELTSQSILDSKCKNAGVSACIFYFLPKDEKCNADCKSKTLTQLAKVANDYKGENLAWFWIREGKQTDFERTFGLATFPGIVGVSLKSNSYSVVRGLADDSKIRDFAKSFVGDTLPSKTLPPGVFPAVKNS